MSITRSYKSRLRHPLLRQRHERAPDPAPGTVAASLSRLPDAVVVDLQRLDDSVDTLDGIYQDILNALERQARDAISVNANLTELFAAQHAQSRSQVLDWSAERAVTPFDAFRQLAERLMSELRPMLDPAGSLAAVPYQDLIEWPDVPAHGDPNQRLLATIEFARQRSLRTFFNEVRARFQPEKMPGNANQLAINDLMTGFCVEQPDLVVLPMKRSSGACMFTLRLIKSPLAMHINKQNLNILLRVNAAIATLARLEGKHKLATTLNEGSASMLLKLTSRQFQYEDNDRHHFADDMIVVMRPDHLQYHMPVQLSELITAAFRAHAPSIIQMH